MRPALSDEIEKLEFAAADAREGTGPTFAVPDFDEAQAVWGAPISAYLTREELGPFYRHSHPMTKIASTLFFKGGTLAEHGLQFKPEIDKGKAMRAIRALLCSFAPPHEIKGGTVGYALSQWCEPISETKADGPQ
jgi:hypothetical protein